MRRTTQPPDSRAPDSSGKRSAETGAPQRRTPATDELDGVFTAVARYFSLLSEPMRLRILHAICQAEQSVSAIVAATGATQTNVSRHLALMHQAGVVSRRREGSAVYYGVADPEFVAICRSVCVQIAGRIDASVPLRQDLLGFAAQRR